MTKKTTHEDDDFMTEKKTKKTAVAPKNTEVPKRKYTKRNTLVTGTKKVGAPTVQIVLPKSAQEAFKLGFITGQFASR